MSNPSITADKTPWYQWDTGLTVTVSGGEMTECHFANRKQGTAYVQAVINGVARVPDELLQVAAPIKAYGFAYDDAGGKTYVDQSFEVIARNIPSDYTYTKTIQKTIRDAEAARDEAVQAAKDAKASELAADDSAVEASNSAQSAGESESAAATSASNAAKSAGEAAKSASEAKAAADNAVEDASAQLKTYTDNAKTSADNAATSASNAADAASAASGSASAAEQSASNAATSASESATSAQEAKTAAGNAASEVLAATKANADAAAQSATDAANSKAGAEAARDEAATSASNAATSADAAAKSASDAAASVNAINVIAPKSVNVAASSEVEGSVAVGAGSVANKENEFSIGNNTLTREITHVSKPTDDTSASTRKYTDDNDAKTLNEAKKYTDANTSNALIGNVSGKLLRVEDAWPSPTLDVVVYGKSVQDGTPTPDAPVPIESVSELSVVSTGKNLLDYQSWKEYIQNNGVFHGTFEFGNDGTIAITATEEDAYTPYQEKGFPNIAVVSGKEYTLSWSADSDKPGFIYVFFNGAIENNVWAYNSTSKNLTFTTPSDCSFITFRLGVLNSGDSIKYSNIQIEPGSNATDYSPYVAGSTTSNLLVSEDGTSYELRSLPDGTRDELVVKDGRKVLRRNTQMFTIQSIASAIYALSEAPNAFFFSAVDITANVDVKNHGVSGYGSTVGVLCNKMINGYSPEQIASNKASGTYAIAIGEDDVFYCNSIGMTTSDEAISWFAENTPTIMIPMKPPVDIDLGPADSITLPDTISNVWIEANLTTECAMTYKRDINIAFDNLVQAVVAAAAGE